mgnify:CR=1 FL=1
MVSAPSQSNGSGRTAIASMSDDGISAALDPRYTFDNFVLGKPNEFAYAAARRLAEAESVPFNPLFLYGGVGLGKTHLMHAIAWHIRRTQPHRTVIYLSCFDHLCGFGGGTGAAALARAACHGAHGRTRPSVMPMTMHASYVNLAMLWQLALVSGGPVQQH